MWRTIIYYLNALGHNFVVVKRAAGVEAASLGHVRCWQFLLQWLVHQAAVLVVNETLAQDHWRSDHWATSVALCNAQGKVCDQQNNSDGHQNHSHQAPHVGHVEGIVALGQGKLLVLLVLRRPSIVNFVVVLFEQIRVECDFRLMCMY